MLSDTVQDVARHFNPESLTSLVVEMAGGMIPTEGRYTTEVYARLMSVKPRTVERYVTDFAIPHKRYGQSIYIDARDFWEAVPYFSKEPPPAKRKKRVRRE